jgi:hypothetical protein
MVHQIVTRGLNKKICVQRWFQKIWRTGRKRVKIKCRQKCLNARNWTKFL